ncbi:MAG: radical SAM protein [Lawsonibacter sp.]|nr:radical SAM protein [Lawsonibacter sp.]
MGIITNLTRTWLTRSAKPFVFTGEFDQILPFEPCENLGLYIHIPFCRSICNFCPYCKTLYDPAVCSRYVDALIEEIHMAGGRAGTKKRVTSLYFGGGTPSLAAGRFGEILAAVREHFTITEGIGVELHPDDVTVPLLQTLREAGVTKISIGIQSFLEKYRTLLGRGGAGAPSMSAALKEVPFETVSMDLIFALPGQTLADLKSDLDAAFASEANHVAIYPFIDFTFTSSPLPAMPKREKRRLLDGITRYCLEKGYVRTSIWTFAREKDARYSSMTRDNFLGFGCSAATLLRDQFKINTFSVEEYCRRIASGQLPTSLTLRFSPRQRMVYYLFWTAYSTRVDPAEFERFFGVPLERMYRLELSAARLLGLVAWRDGVWQMTLKGAFYYHYYENFYTLVYIDKMWGVMRREAFPERIEL